MMGVAIRPRSNTSMELVIKIMKLEDNISRTVATKTKEM